MDDVQVQKFHSVVRWGKTPGEVEEVVKATGFAVTEAVSAPDAKTGNYALHISAQNGHIALTEYLLSQKADPNARNGKGQTATHMSVEYDFYQQTELLLASGADKDLKNEDGFAACTGISGSKVGPEAWDSPLNVLRSAQTKEEVVSAMTMLEKCDHKLLDKASLVQAGMAKRRALPADVWDSKHFMTFVQSMA